MPTVGRNVLEWTFRPQTTGPIRPQPLDVSPLLYYYLGRNVQNGTLCPIFGTFRPLFISTWGETSNFGLDVLPRWGESDRGEMGLPQGNNPPVLFRRLLRRRLVGMSVSMSISREMHFVRYGKYLN